MLNAKLRATGRKYFNEKRLVEIVTVLREGLFHVAGKSDLPHGTLRQMSIRWNVPHQVIREKVRSINANWEKIKTEAKK